MIAATVKYDDHSTAWRRIPNSVTESVAYYQKIESDAKAWGKAVATIDAPRNEVFAFLWCLDCHERKVEHVKDEGGDAIRGVLALRGSRTMFYYNQVKLGFGVSDRMFAT